MRNKLMILFSGLLCGIQFALADDSVAMTNVLSSFVSEKYWERMAATNGIDAILSTTTNECEMAECRLLKSVLLLEHAAIEHDDLFYVEATNYCLAVKGECSAGRDWRFWASTLIQLQALAQHDKFDQVFHVATNSLSLSPPADFERPTNVWIALFGSDIPARISLNDAFRVNAADALLSIDKSSDLFAVTNGIGETAMEMVRDMINASVEK